MQKCQKRQKHLCHDDFMDKSFLGSLLKLSENECIHIFSLILNGWTVEFDSAVSGVSSICLKKDKKC